MFLQDQKWETCTAELEDQIVKLRNNVVDEAINLNQNWALHGAVLFDQVQGRCLVLPRIRKGFRNHIAALLTINIKILNLSFICNLELYRLK